MKRAKWYVLFSQTYSKVLTEPSDFTEGGVRGVDVGGGVGVGMGVGEGVGVNLEKT